MRLNRIKSICDFIFSRNGTNGAKPEDVHPGQMALEGRVGQELIVRGVQDGKTKIYRDTLAYSPGKDSFCLGNSFGHYLIHIHYDMTKNPDLVKTWGEHAYREFRVHSIELLDGTTVYTDDSVPFEAQD